MSPITNPQTAVAYLRVSTAQQVESGLGLEGQKAAIQDYAKKNHIEIVDWHTDGGVSGGADIEDRPGLVSAMSSVVQHRAGMLLVQKQVGCMHPMTKIRTDTVQVMPKNTNADVTKKCVSVTKHKQ